jgi:hypothetical protein
MHNVGQIIAVNNKPHLYLGVSPSLTYLVFDGKTSRELLKGESLSTIWSNPDTPWMGPCVKAWDLELIFFGTIKESFLKKKGVKPFIRKALATATKSINCGETYIPGYKVPEEDQRPPPFKWKGAYDAF